MTSQVKNSLDQSSTAQHTVSFAPTNTKLAWNKPTLIEVNLGDAEHNKISRTTEGVRHGQAS
jgi:hypothetical protein